ncbi:universal stress protein [Acuticoccus mangrovi]|uniref:Universal stress protein n=1 Tax=Acuticoccus mangrovi TaxID=2796142 RepID=A0A934IRW2_9HYPH|nr:universal stress protein [Acuticoccus mangrovi]
MFSKIIVPVDLTHADRLSRALEVAGKLAKLYDAPIVYVGVSPNVPTEVAHSPAEFEAKLAAFAEAEAAAHGVAASAHAFFSHDPAIDLDEALPKLVKELGGDLVVMASHVPGFLDRLWHSHGATLAGHTDASIFLVR